MFENFKHSLINHSINSLSINFDKSIKLFFVCKKDMNHTTLFFLNVAIWNEKSQILRSLTFPPKNVQPVITIVIRGIKIFFKIYADYFNSLNLIDRNKLSSPSLELSDDVVVNSI